MLRPEEIIEIEIQDTSPDIKVRVSICVLTHNRGSLLRNLLFSIQQLKYEPIEIIVIDNHSSDFTEEMVKNEFPRIKYVRTKRNIGVAARNIGLRMATGDIILTIDDDIVGINDNEIINLKQHFLFKKELGAINFKVIDSVTEQVCNWIHHCKPEEYSNREFLTYEITEGAVAFRKVALEKAGYYAETFFLGHEGPDLAFRIMDNGYDVIYSNLVTVKHYHSDLGRKAWYKYYYETRNQFWLVTRNLPLTYGAIHLLRGLSSTLVYSVRDGYLSYWIKAIVDGIKGSRNAFKDRKVLKKEVLRVIKDIDKNRADFFYLFKKKLFKKGMRL